MIVNTTTGEILDLSPLRRKPTGRVTRVNAQPARRRYPRRNRELEAYRTILAFAIVSFVFWFSLTA